MDNKFRIFIKNLRNTYGLHLITHKYLKQFSMKELRAMVSNTTQLPHPLPGPATHCLCTCTLTLGRGRGGGGEAEEGWRDNSSQSWVENPNI
jgi:hypothetical protein